MRKTRRGLALMLGMALVIAACGEGDDPLDDAPDENGTEDTEPDEGDNGDASDGDTVNLVMESWRNDDLAVWEDDILPVFHEQHPDINVTFQPSAPDEYNAALESRLGGGSAGDLITCRPYDVSVDLYEDGHYESLNDLDGIENFDEVATSAWIDDSGEDIFCVPMASAMHGFFYNVDIFDELGLEAPETEAEFYDVLDEIAEDGTYDPLAMGTSDQWEAATMGLQNVGPTYWEGEEGRQRMIDGEEGWDDEPYVNAFQALADWAEYLPAGYESITYSDAQNLFTLGQGAVYPTGSWEIALFEEQADFEIGAFPPPLPEGHDTLWVSDTPDIGLGINPATDHPDEAWTFMEWVASEEFAELYANALPGFLPMIDVEVENELAQEFLSWRELGDTTIRNSYQLLSRGEPNLENDLWDASAQVINGTETPEEAGARVQQGLESWYEPGMFD